MGLIFAKKIHMYCRDLQLPQTNLIVKTKSIRQTFYVDGYQHFWHPHICHIQDNFDLKSL